MTLDLAARYVAWYMTDNPADRIIALEWWPDGQPASSMSFGRLYFAMRDDPGDVWGPPRLIGELPYVAAESYARSEGFTVCVQHTEPLALGSRVDPGEHGPAATGAS